MTQKIKITSKSGQTIIEIDGKKIDGVKSMVLHQRVGEELPTLGLFLHGLDVEIEGDADVKLIREEYDDENVSE